MDIAELQEELARERRARLAAERLLDLKKKELGAANQQLSNHALQLSGTIIDQRKVVSTLQGENNRVVEDLHRAKDKVIAVERLLWDALENIPDGFALFDADRKLVIANQPYLSVFREAGGVAVGASYQSILDICLDDGLVDLEGGDEDAWYDQMLDRWDEEVISPITLRFWNGMYVRMVDRRTADGGIVSLALNTTEAIVREEELRIARDTAEAADRAKSAFLARMSHELRTPMNGVVGMADLLIELELDEEAQLYSETIRNSGQALLEIINNILDFSKLEAEKLELREAVFDLEQLAQDVCMIVTPSLRDKDVDLLIDYDQFLPTQFIGDAGRIRQIILNLVGNAIKFTECGTIMLRFVGVQAEPDGGWQVHITVEDSGIGIMDQLKEHIFGEFNQIEDGANRRYEGTGLGLAITKKLVEVMGGEIWVDSIPGQGSCFGVRITLQHAAPADMPSTCLPERLRTALVWIKAPLDRSLMERQLELLGVEARVVNTAAEYDLALKAAPPDVVLVGISRQEPARAMLDGSDLAGRVISIAEEPGQAADLPKPFTRTRLFGALSAAMEDGRACTLERPLRVLAAEDNDTNQLVLSKMLQGLDIDLQIVGDGLQVVEAFRDATPDLILMDISMPGMDGMEAAQAIRQIERDGAHVQIVAMTAHALHGDEDHIREAGIDHYMTKPLRKRALEEHIDAVRATLKRDQCAS